MSSATHDEGKRELSGGAAEIHGHYSGSGGPVWWETIPAKPATMVDLPNDLHPALVSALHRLGRRQLYSHQRETIEVVRQGKDLMLVTATASGKTLAFNAAILDSILKSGGRAIYLYPLNALANDQYAALTELVAGLPARVQLRVGRATGQSEQNERRAARTSDLVLTNPEMVHFSVLRNPQLWRGLLSSLRFVVVDEAHLYRGAFGAHVAHLLRRLTRLSESMGGRPRFIAASATIGNPVEHGSMLIGRSIEVLSGDGSPAPERQLVVWEPPHYLDEEGNKRYLSYEDESVRVLSAALHAGKSAILFVRSRRSVESVIDEVQRLLRKEGHDHLANRVAPYRGGYSATERKNIEAGLRNGEVRAVVSTVALEVGIDIGSLDVVIIAGYPGSMMSFWQQAGRAGRRGGQSQVIYIPSNNALDAYYARSPKLLLTTPQELATFDPWNPHIAVPHLAWSAGETVVSSTGPWENDRQRHYAQRLVDGGFLAIENGRYVPARPLPYEVTLRAIEGRPYKITDAAGQLVGEQDQDYLFRECHPGAIYVHRGSAYRVLRIDDDEREVHVEGPETWTTETRADQDNQVSIVSELAARHIGLSDSGCDVKLVRVTATETYHQFVETKRADGAHVRTVPIDPPLTRARKTLGLVIELPARTDEVAAHSIEHAILGMIPTEVMADRREFTGHTNGSTIVLYERHRDGLGFSQKAFERIDRIIAAAAERLAGCDCVTGCPRCIQSGSCERWNEELGKRDASVLLDALLGVIRDAPQPSPRPVPASSAESGTPPRGAAEAMRAIADSAAAEYQAAATLAIDYGNADGWIRDDGGAGEPTLGEPVMHTAFGAGTVTEVDTQQRQVVVDFGGESRRLVFGRGHLLVLASRERT